MHVRFQCYKLVWVYKRLLIVELISNVMQDIPKIILVTNIIELSRYNMYIVETVFDNL